jgi:menaquinone-9 beta-reductase
MGRDCEVFIIGGGPAGLAAAIAASQRGFSVTVADGNQPPIDKACGEGLMPDAVFALQQLGVFLSPQEGRRFRGIRFLNEGNACANVPEARFPGPPAIGIRRVVLHQKIIERAESCGVRLLWNTPVSGITSAGVLLGRNLICARWVIGADGSKSRVRRWCGLESSAGKWHRFAYRQHFQTKPWTDFVEVYWSNAAQAYVTPLDENEVGVAVISHDPKLRMKAAWREFPHLAARLAGAQPASSERGAVTGMHRLRRVFRENVALIGDASGNVDAITGEGLNLAFRQALGLAEALQSSNLAQYQKAHDRISLRPRLMGRALLWMDGHLGLRHRVMKTLAQNGGIFSRLLAVHVGEGSTLEMAATGALFGMRLLTT